MNATNNQTKLDAQTVKKIVERFINESLAKTKQSRVVMILGSHAMGGESTPGEPNLELTVTFSVADRDV